MKNMFSNNVVLPMTDVICDAFNTAVKIKGKSAQKLTLPVVPLAVIATILRTAAMKDKNLEDLVEPLMDVCEIFSVRPSEAENLTTLTAAYERISKLVHASYGILDEEDSDEDEDFDDEEFDEEDEKDDEEDEEDEDGDDAEIDTLVDTFDKVAAALKALNNLSVKKDGGKK